MEITFALAQYPVTQFGTFSEWQQHVSSWVETAVEQQAKILVFPEYGSMELVSLFPGEIQQDLHAQIDELQRLLPEFKETFRSLARKHRCIIVAPSFPEFTGERFVNRAYVFSENGEGFQDKWFMTRFEHESWGISAAEEQVITVFQSGFGNFGIQICYDVEFPLGSQILAQNGAAIVFSPSCTETIRGATRVHVGARARALEQQLYTGVSQLTGNADWSPAVDINYGYGAVYCSPDRDLPEEGIVKKSAAQEREWLVATVDTQLNEAVRNDGQVFNFRDSANVEMSISCGYTVRKCTL